MLLCFALDAADQVASSVAFAHGSCFPYGVVKRIRFEDFKGRSCPNLSPELRARLNEVKAYQGCERLIFSTQIIQLWEQSPQLLVMLHAFVHTLADTP